jgi:hypothetical protein
MRDDEIERILDYLARQCPADSKRDFDALEEKLTLVRKTLKEVAERNRKTSQLIKEGGRRGRLTDIRLALLRWRLNADG